MSNNQFCVVKRNGSKEEVSFDKVTRRIKKLCFFIFGVAHGCVIRSKDVFKARSKI
jgi:hypothetical protein